ncbi:MAG: hypothetical protein KAI89_04110 [Emcibacter sp.]|nr:hypothetical protein [Emcibacter sp.]
MLFQNGADGCWINYYRPDVCRVAQGHRIRVGFALLAGNICVFFRVRPVIVVGVLLTFILMSVYVEIV